MEIIDIRKIFQCHAGAVTCLTASPISGLVVSGGTDGRICVYDLERKMMIKSVKYGSGVSFMTWIPLDMDWSGTQVKKIQSLATFKFN